MKAFTYLRPESAAAAARAAAADTTELKAAGVDLLDRMKERLITPDAVVALLEAPDPDARRIAIGEDGSLWIGAFVTLSQLATHPLIHKHLGALAEAAGGAASFQIRNRATLGGNLAQHTRCGYYRIASFPCFKRGAPTCPVLEDGAVQDTAGIFANSACASAHPSSLAPVLGAAGATVRVRRASGKGTRDADVAFAAFYRAPERGRGGDTSLSKGDVIVGVHLPPDNERRKTGYAEVRQMAAFDWALASCAVRLERTDDGKIAAATVWYGSLAPTPHRSAEAEGALVGQALDGSAGDAAFQAAAERAVASATPLQGNRYKQHLAKVVLRRAATAAAGRGS